MLRAAGVAIALPWLEALAPRTARGQAAPAPKRFLPISFPCGAPGYWWPQTAGAGDAFQLSSVLEPLAPLKQQLLLIGNLENGSAFNADGSFSVEPSHGRLSGGFMTCVDGVALNKTLQRQNNNVPLGYEVNGVSADQILCQATPGVTPLDSLQVGLTTTDSYCDGEPCSYSRSISWSSENRALYKQIDPQQIFDTLFGSGGLTGPAAGRRDRSVLDAVLTSSKALEPKLGAYDRQILERYLTSIRDAEKAISQPQSCSAKPTRPTFTAVKGMVNGQDGYDRNTHADVMNQLVALAFQCDLTRVISYMLEDERSEFVYNHLTVRNFTPTTSTPGPPGVLCGELHGSGQEAGDINDPWCTMCYWHTQKVAGLAQLLASMPEGDGSVLDSTIILYASCMHGADHSSLDLPVALVGGKSMLKTNQYLRYANPTPLRNLYYTLLKGCFDIQVDSFGNDLTGRPQQLLGEILA